MIIDDTAFDDITGEGLSDEDIPSALEAVLLVVDSPATDEALAAAVGRSIGIVREHLTAIATRLANAGSGIDLREFGGGWRFYTRDVFAPVVERFVMDGTQTRLSKAALETLAVVAYRQPVTRARISAVRAVNVDGVVRTLVARGMIEEEGADADTGGTLYRTTEMFLERMGLASLEDLPALGPLLPDVDAIDDE
ncbi:MAG: SMC-Scp complex subunit ScpB [Nakamurella sp.]